MSTYKPYKPTFAFDTDEIDVNAIASTLGDEQKTKAEKDPIDEGLLNRIKTSSSLRDLSLGQMQLDKMRDDLRKQGINPVSTEYVKESADRNYRLRESFGNAGMTIDENDYIDLTQPTANQNIWRKRIDKLVASGLAEEHKDAGGKRVGITLKNDNDISPYIDRAYISASLPETMSDVAQSDYFSELTSNVIAQLPKNKKGEIIYGGVPYQWAELYEAFYPVVAEKAHDHLLKDNRAYYNWIFESAMGMPYEEWYKSYADKRVSEIEQKIIELRDAVAEETAQIAEGRGREVALSSGTLVPASLLGWASKEGARIEASKQFNDVLESINTFRNNDFKSGLNEGFDWVDALSFGLADLGTSYSQLQLLEKAKNGEELSISESKVLELLQLTQEFENIKKSLGWERSLGSSVGSGLGSTLAMAPGFAFGMTGASRIGTTVKLASGIAKEASKKQAVKQVGKNLLHNAGVAYARGAVVAPFMPSTYTTGVKELQEQYSFNPDGTLKFEPNSKALAFMGGYIDTMNEYASEVFGSTLGEIIGYGARTFGRVTRLNKAVDAVMNPINTGLSKAIDKGLSYLPIEDEAKLAGVRKALRGMIVPNAELDDETKELMRMWGVQDGYVAEATSEVFGDLMSQVMRDVVGAKTDYSDFEDSTYWSTQLLVAVLYGGSMNALAHIKEGVSDYQQLVDLGKYNKKLLDRIENKDLRNKVLAAIADGSIEEISAKLADIVKGHHPTNRAKVLDYARNAMVIQTIAGKVEDGGRVDAFVRNAAKLSGVGYKGGDIIMETTVGGREYYIVDGKPADRSESSMLTCIDKETGEKKAILSSALPEQPSIRSLTDVMEQMFTEQFSAQTEATRLSSLQSAYNQMERPTAEIARDMMQRYGITPPAEEDVVTLADGRKVKVLQDIEDGTYVVRLEGPEPKLFTIPFYSIRSNNPLTAEAQRVMIEGEVVSATNKTVDLATAEVENENVTEVTMTQPTGEKATPTETDTQTVEAIAQKEEQVANDTLDMTDIPTDAEGNIDFDAIDDPVQYAALYEREAGSKAEAAKEVADLRSKTLEAAAKLEEQAKNEITASAKRKKLKEAKKLRDRAAFYDKVLPKFEEMEEEYTSVVKNEYSQQIAEPTLRVLDAMAKKLGLKVRFVEEVEGGKANAQITKDGYVEIAFERRDKSITFLMGHEFTHRMQDLSPEQYAEYKQMVKDFVGEESWSRELNRLKAIYAVHRIAIEDESLEDEITADMAGALVEQRDAFLNYLEGKKNDTTFLSKVLEFLHDMVTIFKAAQETEREKQIKDLADALTGIIRSSETAQQNVNGPETDNAVHGEERHSIIGEVGASALDMAEEVTIRLDNLAVARDMETAGKDAKDIRMATGWERGADGLWRYEIMDAIVNLYDGDENTIRKKIEVAEEEEKDFMQQSKADTKELRERTNTYLAQMREKYGVAEGEETDAMTEEEIAHLQSLTNKEIEFEDYKERRRNELYNRRMALEAQLGYVRVKNTDDSAMILSTRLGYILQGNDAEVLFTAHPSLRDIEVQFVTDIRDGAFAAYATKGGYKRIELNAKKTPVDMIAPYILHEVQHAIQDIEGFAGGGNLSSLQSDENITAKEAYDYYHKIAGEVEARNVSARINMTPEERRATLLYETEDVAREDQIFLRESVMQGQPKFSLQVSAEELAEIEAERKAIIETAKAKGTYLKAPNGKDTNLTPEQWVDVRTSRFKKWFGDWELATKVIDIVNVAKKHGFKNFADARKWAKENIVGTYANNEIGSVSISKTVIEKYLSQKAVEQSDNKEAHLSALKFLPTIIEKSVVGDVHQDRDGNANIKDVVRLFGCIEIDGVLYRVKTTIKRYSDSNLLPKAYSYEVTEIELLDGHWITHTQSADFIPTSNNSITATKLLKGVKKNNSNEEILSHSWVIDENGEPKVVYHGTPKGGFTVFNSNPKGKTQGTGAWFASDRSNAVTYSGRNYVEFDAPSTIEDLYYLIENNEAYENIKIKEIFYIKDEEGNEWEYGTLQELENDGWEDYTSEDIRKEYILYDGLSYMGTYTIAEESDMLNDAVAIAENAEMPMLYEVFLNIREPFIVDAEGKNWQELDLGSTDATAREGRYGGYDGTIIKNVEDGGNVAAYTTTDYIVHDPNQIKSATNNVGTYDANNPDIRHSLITPEMDATYLDAVERGDMATAQKMVMEAAKLAMPNTKVIDENGEPKVVWHGGQFGISSFIPRQNMHFGTKKAAMQRILDEQWGYDNWLVQNEDGSYSWKYEDEYDEGYNVQSNKTFATEEEAMEDALLYLGDEVVVKPYFLNIRNIKRTDDAQSSWDDAIEVVKAESDNVDGIVYENWYEDKGSDSYLAFSPNQIKYADPVTYDDNGNVIPLSERFNPEKEDIRYSLSEETTQIFDAAKAKFGTTYDMREAGYILPDGSMLDFSGRHQVKGDASFLNGDRTVDHRDISDIAYDADDNETGIKTDLGDFLDRGAIRIDYNAGAINLNVAPTKAQKDRLKRLIERNEGYVYVDFGKGWDTEHYAEYEAARASRVLGDIDRYFDEGIKPTGNVRFSLQTINALSDALTEYTANGDITSFVDSVRAENERFGGHQYITNLIMDYEEDGDAEWFAEKIKDIVGDAKEPYTYTANGDMVADVDEVGDVLGVKSDARHSIIGEIGAANLDTYGRYGSPMLALEMAREFETEGKTAREIRLATNWERGADGKWRYEIMDGVYRHPQNDDITAKEYRLADILDNPDLYKAYPYLKDLKVSYNAEMTSNGRYNGKGIELKSTRTPEQINSTLIHEVQHAIQYAEMFAKGGSVKSIAKELVAEGKQLAEEFKNTPNVYILRKGYLLYQIARKAMASVKADTKATEAYRSLAGEVEARNTQKRMEMTEEQRLKTLLSATEDVARDAQRILFYEATGGALNARHSVRHDMTEEDAYQASLLEEAMRMEREATSNGMDIAQEIADATGWVHLANGKWKYYGEGKLDITDKASAARAAFRWLESKKAVKKAQIRKVYYPLIKGSKAQIAEIERNQSADYAKLKRYADKVEYILQGNAVESLPIEDQILVDIALGQRLKWNDGDGKRGLKSELGLQSAKNERMGAVTLGARDYVEDYVERLMERNNGYEQGLNDNDIRNAVIEVFSSYPSPKAAIEELYARYKPDTEIALAEEGLARLEYERDAALAEVDAEYNEIFEDFDNNPDKYVREHQEAESYNANLDMYVGSLTKARKMVERLEKQQTKRKLSDEEKMAAMRAVKSAVAKELRDGLGRYTRKYDIQRMMDAVSDARTPYAMLKAIDKAMESLFEIKWRREYARMQMLTKSKLSYGVTAIDASSFLNTFVSEHKITAADARKIMNDMWKGAKSNGVSVAKYIDDTTRQAMEFISEMAEYAEARARFSDIEATEIIAFTRKLREKLEDYTSLNDYKLKTALANDAVRKAIIDAVDILEMYWKAQELQLSLNDDKHRRDISALEIKAKEITAQLREVNQQIKDLANGKVVVTSSGVKDRDLLRKELQERYNTLLAEREEAYAEMYNAMPDIVNLMQQANRAVETLLRTGKVNLAIERTKRKEHEKELINDVLADLASPASTTKHHIDIRKKNLFERIAAGIGSTIGAPLGSMDYMLRAIGRNAPLGEGRVYKRFAYAFQNAYDNIYTALEARKKMLDDKCKSLWGESYHKVHKMAESTKVMTITYPSAINTKDGKWEPVENTTDIYATQAMYILAMWNQAEGRVTLERQGFTDERINAIRDALNRVDARWIEFADWVVEEYLPSGRERYNAVHRDIFGISMTAVPNYFPIKRAKEKLQKEEDVAKGDANLLPSTVVGAIKERTSNVVPIDLETSFFEALNENTTVMEAWAEMAGLIQDINTILSNGAVKTTMLDINDTLFSDFKKAAQVATLSYIGKTPDIDKKLGTILNRLWAGSKIAFRLNTAFKQLSSALLFAGYSGDPKFQATLLWRYLGGVGKMPVALMNGIIEGASHLTGHSLTNIDIMTNIEWAKANMPSFAKRWNEGVAGYDIMARTTSGNTSWKQRAWYVKFDDAVRAVTKFGMKPNAFIDAFTSAAGARAVYDYTYEEMRKEGYSEDDAHTLAIINAEMAFNTTQQSSEGLYLAPMQMDRSVVATTLSTFMNAPYAMFRNTMIGVKEIFRDAKKELAEIERLEFKRAMDAAKKQVETQVAAEVDRGEYSEEEAKKRRNELFDFAKAKIIPLVKERAYNKYVKAQTKAVVMVFLNGYAGQVAFNLMGKLAEFMFGDDDEEKKKMFYDITIASAWEAPVSMMPLGGYITSMTNGYSASFFPAMDELSKEFSTIVKRLREEGISPEVIYAATTMCMRWGLGLNVDTIVNIALGIDSMFEDGVSAEAILKFINAPEGQIRKIVLQRRENETSKEYAERVMRFYSIFDTPIYEDYFYAVGEKRGKRSNDNTPRGMSQKQMNDIKVQEAYRRSVILRNGGGKQLSEIEETRKSYNKLKNKGYGDMHKNEKKILSDITKAINKREFVLMRLEDEAKYYDIVMRIKRDQERYIELYEQFNK